jgi:hypothetical protein
MSGRIPSRGGLLRRVRALVATASMFTFVPIPMYTTTPNEGSTYGFMPVFLSMDDEGAVRTIYAPSISWNKAAGVNTTFRYYLFPNIVKSLSFVAAASTHINRTLWLTYTDLPTEEEDYTLEFVEMVRRNLFFRFFGIGPNTPFSGQSSYTRTTLLATARPGWNFPHHINVGVRFTLRGDKPEEHAIFGLPTTQQAYPDAPGLAGASQAAIGASIRYDTRPFRDYSEDGTFAELSGNFHQGLKNVGQFGNVTLEARGLIKETEWTQSAGRFYLNSVFGGGPGVPFYYLSSLGGEVLLRGFPEDRFIDRNAWEMEFEQRLRVLQLHLFDAVSDWRVDPFVAIGQVFGDWNQIIDHIRYSVGIGLRAWVHPNVLGRVDVAWAGEGFRAYVVLGYPF